MEELRDEREERVKEEQRVIMINPTKTTVCHKVLSLAQQEQSKERVQQEGDQRETGKKFKKAHKNSVHLFYFSTHCDFYKLPWQSWGSGLADRQGGDRSEAPRYWSSLCSTRSPDLAAMRSRVRAGLFLSKKDPMAAPA